VQNKEAYLRERHGVQQNISVMETLQRHFLFQLLFHRGKGKYR
jgi:hypothetical protein